LLRSLDLGQYLPEPLIQAAMGKKETVVSKLCHELAITRATLYRYVAPDGTLRKQGEIALGMREMQG